MKHVLGMLVLVCVLAGCGTQTFDVPYPIAVGKMTEAYPTTDPDNAARYADLPAYSNEGGGTPWELTATHEETVPGQVYVITIHKDWKFVNPRTTTFTIRNVGDASCSVEVLSRRKMAVGSMRDRGYENVRMMEVKDILKLPDNPMFRD